MNRGRELDRICELANVGAGHAASALAMLVGAPIRMSVPRVRRASVDPPVGEGVCGVFFEVEGGLGGVFAVLFPAPARDRLVLSLLGDAAAAADVGGDQAESALREVGNILASHALSAVADLIGCSVLPSIPTLAMDHASAVLAALDVRTGARRPDLRIETDLLDLEGGLRGHVVWIPAA